MLLFLMLTNGFTIVRCVEILTRAEECIVVNMWLPESLSMSGPLFFADTGCGLYAAGSPSRST